MNRNDFLSMIENRGPADRHMIGEVSELITIFPYFQSAYMLLLKGLQNTADVKFENQLRLSAMHIADREILYYLLKQEPVVEQKPENEIKPPEVKVISPVDTEQTVIDSGKSSEDLINKIEKSDSESRKNETDKDRPVIVSVESDIIDSDATILLIDEESGTVEEKIIYMDPGFSIPEPADLLELDIDSGKSPGSADIIIAADQEIHETQKTSRQIQSDLIEKFIIANPRIEPKKEKSDIPVEDISKPYIEERGEFVTETLAKIYVRQGYYSRAINIYEKLSLKYPEKSSYFASQIEKVKELLKK